MWCGGDDAGRAWPGPEALPVNLAESDGHGMMGATAGHRSPGRPARARPVGRHVGGGSIDPDDLARLNSLLVADIRFAVEPAREPASTASGVLTHRVSGRRQRSASFPVICSAVRRQLLHSLAGSLAECAMTLGLGAGVYRGSRATPGSLGARRFRAAGGSAVARPLGRGKSP